MAKLHSCFSRKRGGAGKLSKVQENVEKTLYNFSEVKYNTFIDKPDKRELRKGVLNMKKGLALVLALLAVLTLGLTGCGNKDTEKTDAEYVKEKGKLIVGITDFAPMDYEETKGSGKWIGFDADMATAFAKELGVEVEFIEINWDNKVMELNNKTIDVVWNGMTLDNGVKAAMGTSNAYCKNAQVVVVNKADKDKYATKESLADLNFAVEGGSAGEKQAEANGWSKTALTTQADALKEVAAGTSNASIIDLLMAGAMIGEGTSYPDLAYTVALNSEEYGVGFRKNSDLVGKLNDFFKKAYADGSMMETAKKYGVQESIIAQ